MKVLESLRVRRSCTRVSTQASFVVTTLYSFVRNGCGMIPPAVAMDQYRAEVAEVPQRCVASTRGMSISSPQARAPKASATPKPLEANYIVDS